MAALEEQQKKTSRRNYAKEIFTIAIVKCSGGNIMCMVFSLQTGKPVRVGGMTVTGK